MKIRIATTTSSASQLFKIAALRRLAEPVRE
jgi:hypothetical protein